MARINKFASVNLNDLFGKEESAVKIAVNSSGSGARPKGANHGMLVLTCPVKQPIRIGSGIAGNSKKQSSESSTPIENNSSVSSNTSPMGSANGGIIKGNSEPVYPINEPKSYIPPSHRDSRFTSVSSVSLKPEPVTVGKTTVPHGDEFPSLQASLGTSNTNYQQHRTKELQQKQKDNQLDAKEQLGKLQQLSLQAHSKSNLDDTNEPDINRFQPQRPGFFRPPHLRGDRLAKPKMVTERSDRPLSRDSDLTGDSNSSGWGDDERANGFRVRPDSVDSDKRPGSGGYSERIYQGDDISNENPTHDTFRPLELAQSDYVVNMKEGRADMGSLWDNKAMFAPPSKGGMYEREVLSRPLSGGSSYNDREALPRPGSGGSRYERQALPRPGSGGSRYERQALPRPGLGGCTSGYEREALPRPGSGGSRFDQEAFPWPISSGSRYEWEAMPQSDSGRRRYEKEALPRSGSGDHRFEQEALPQPVSGGRYEKEVLPRPCSGGSRYEREIFQQPGSDGSRFEQEALARPVSGGNRYRKETLACPGSGGHESEAIPRPGSSGYSYDGEVISQLDSGGDNYSRAASGGSGYGRKELSWPGTAGICYPQQGFNGGSDCVRPNSGGRSCEREVVSRPGSGGNRNDRPGLGAVDNRMSRPGLGINGQIDGEELCRDSSFNGKQNYQRRVTNPSRGHYMGRNRNIHYSHEIDREKGPSRDNWFRPGSMSRELPNRDNYHGRWGQTIVEGYNSATTRENSRHVAAEGSF